MNDDTNNAPWNKVLTEQARRNRARPTAAEAQLWQHLRGRRLDGFKFRRQHPIDRFIVDFCCLERCLIVEVDGLAHQQLAERDAERTAVLQALGYRVFRCTNDQIERNIAAVLDLIRATLSE
ncbi:MAG TPA: DUF559 domain-containing protein [Roseiflexaceae bacterium]